MRPLLLIAFLSLSLSAFLFFRQVPIAGAPSRELVAGVSSPESPGLPLRLIIPTLKINAAIQYVGIDSSGEMSSPADPAEVGWYKYGTIPGEIGSSVLAGHLNGRNGEPGVFAEISKLKTGDILYIRNYDGGLVTFAVREVREFEPGRFGEVFLPADSPHLNLVTCVGVWDENKESYTKRLVVFADIVRQ